MHQHPKYKLHQRQLQNLLNQNKEEQKIIITEIIIMVIILIETIITTTEIIIKIEITTIKTEHIIMEKMVLDNSIIGIITDFKIIEIITNNVLILTEMKEDHQIIKEQIETLKILCLQKLKKKIKEITVQKLQISKK